MDCEVIGLVVEENEGHSTGKVTLRGPTGTIVLVCDADMAKSLRIGRTVELRLIRSRAGRDERQVDIEEVIEAKARPTKLGAEA